MDITPQFEPLRRLLRAGLTDLLTELDSTYKAEFFRLTDVEQHDAIMRLNDVLVRAVSSFIVETGIIMDTVVKPAWLIALRVRVAASEGEPCLPRIRSFLAVIGQADPLNGLSA